MVIGYVGNLQGKSFGLFILKQFVEQVIVTSKSSLCFLVTAAGDNFDAQGELL